ncbi:hypothetical protein NLJ89_g315 [Agrocybe chaxingu]|uniref:J domain-containing protein n=1 Tax=Agrocybe chaxingu TaxID=84603 RepID=A0A9W8TFA8_9AGAR|nr:hypothetical protein NLJ89_g315 [Agrocybe chaxingu]
MSTGLYEELGISKDASPEEVRKAYKKKALLTHPDRLPPGATAAEKSEAEENFRRVNNAYEVLHDPKKRSGNEHITRTLPDGRRIRTINGVEQQQQPRGHVSYTDTSKMRSPDPSANRYLTAPPPRSQTMQVASTSRMDYGNPHPPPYPGPPPVIPSYRAPTPQANSHRRSRRASEKYNYSSNPNPDHDMQDRGVQDERHHKKWWSRGH